MFEREVVPAVTTSNPTITEVADVTPYKEVSSWVASGNGEFVAVTSIYQTSNYYTWTTSLFQNGKWLFSIDHGPRGLRPKFSLDSKYFSWYDGLNTIRTIDLLSQLQIHIVTEERKVAAFDLSPLKTLAVCTIHPSDESLQASNETYSITIYQENGNGSDVSIPMDSILGPMQIAFSVEGEFLFVGISGTTYYNTFVHVYGTAPLQLVRVWGQKTTPTPILLPLGQDMAFCFLSKVENLRTHLKVNLTSRVNVTTVCDAEFTEYINVFLSGNRLLVLEQRGGKAIILELDKKAMVFRAYGALRAWTQQLEITKCGLTEELKEFWWWDDWKVLKTRITLASDNIAS